MSVHKRFDYTKRVINSIITSMDYSKTQLPVIFSIDYFDDKIVNLIETYAPKFIDAKIIVNTPAIGCNNNTLSVMRKGFERHSKIIHIEDDTTLAKDAIAFLLDKLNEYENDNNIFSISGYNRTTDFPTEEKIDLIEKQNHFTCWGIGLWKNKWLRVMNNWIQNSDNRNKTKSWDSHINDSIVKLDPDMLQVRPLVSRIQNIGAENGSWVPNANWHFLHHRSPFTSDDYYD